MHRHELDPISLVAGLVFAGIGVLSLLQTGPGLPARWVAPILLIGGGVVGLAASRRRRGGPPSG